MAKLLTHHDRYHVHAILGLLSLLHFAVRSGYVFCTGVDAFLAMPQFAFGTLLLHVGLHISSFQFILPKRMWSKPMIWDEFRLHNAIFAGRNLLGAFLGTYFAEWWQPSLSNPTSFLFKIALILCTCALADIATAKCGSTTYRTTNAMPYPPNTPKNVEQEAKRFYARAQFGAAAASVMAPPTLSFLCVLGIEGASLLMTLVRKGIIEARHYHMLYTISLVHVYFALARMVLYDMELHCTWALMSGLAWLFACFLRFHSPLSKYIVWPVALVSAACVDGLVAAALPQYLRPWFGVVVLGIIGLADVSAIPTAFCCCLVASEDASEPVDERSNKGSKCEDDERAAAQGSYGGS
mmetsp:Transcript_41376/g.74909  ORF Transcript_41376/g.74909 Transcript_41376/m.74909 type:complete len:352 (+) Transcript_41376:73-1128(+)